MANALQRQFRNYAYWEKRERIAREQYMRTEAEQIAEIQRIYRGMEQWAEDEINRFYGKYAGTEIHSEGNVYMILRQSDILAVIG